MLPKPRQTITDLANRLATHILPTCQSEFAMADSGLLANLLVTAAQEFERAVETRMQDIADLQALFRSYASILPSEIPWQTLLDAQPESLHLDHVNQLHAQFLDTFIAIHTWAEDQAQAELEAAAWAFLRRHTERHKYEGIAV